MPTAIIPSDFTYRGIPFKFGEPDYNDATFCNAQKIAVPEGTKVVHFLVASAPMPFRRGDTPQQVQPVDPNKPVTANFKVGDNTFPKAISSYTGFYGVYGWPGYYESKI